MPRFQRLLPKPAPRDAVLAVTVTPSLSVTDPASMTMPPPIDLELPVLGTATHVPS